MYVQLPGTTEVVTCGRYQQRQSRTGAVTGAFVYGRRYLERTDAVALDPIHLPLTSRTVETAKLGGIFGALRDASPDAWGRRVIEHARHRAELSEVEHLLHSPEDRAGALSFGRSQTPPSPLWSYNRIVQLPELLEAAQLLQDDASSTRLAADLQHAALVLQEPGTSMGGARPKSVVQDDHGLWLAKFPSRGDRWTNATVEAGLLALAQRCEIRTPPTRIERIGDAQVLLVRRFDRERLAHDVLDTPRYVRHRMVSALTVLDADDSADARAQWSYVVLADELRRWSIQGRADRHELFRRMVFNALVSNLDDHPRNHALVAPPRGWQLAPAYDITPEPRPGQHERELAMISGRFGRRASRGNLVSQAKRFDLTAVEAHAVIEMLVAIVRAEWEGVLRANGATVADCAVVSTAFVDEGFEYPVPEHCV